jgi:PAS domain S-box-containing protein
VARDLVVEKMRDGMMVLDAEGNIIDINTALQKALGISVSQAIGQRAEDVFHAWPSLIERYKNVLEAQDEIVLGEDESRTWYELHISSLVDSSGHLLGRVLIVRSITEAKQTEEAWRRSEYGSEEKLPGIVLPQEPTSIFPKNQGEDPAPIPQAPSRLRVFLCHSSNDKPLVRKLYQRLKADNFDPWLDEKKLLAGQDWEQEIPKAVRKADVVIVCLSRGSITKAGYIQKEIKYALDIADEQPEGTIFLIPLKLEECEVPERLSRWHWVNYFERNGYKRLLDSLNARASVR